MPHRRTTRAFVGLLLLVPLLIAGALVPSTATAAGEGRITGRVTDIHGAGLAGITVRAANGPVASSDTTDADGSFALGPLYSGEYLVEFTDPSGTYLDEYWQDVTGDWHAAAQVPVSDGQATVLAAQLTKGARISGTVLGAGGVPLAGAQVGVSQIVAEGTPNGGGGMERTDSSGHYVVDHLPPGVYTVGFADTRGRHAAEFWSDTYAKENATRIVLTEGQLVSSIDATLGLGATLGGRLVDYDGKPLVLMNIDAFRWNDARRVWEAVRAAATTGLTGLYTIRNLASGTYRLSVASYRHRTVVWKDSRSVTLRAGQTRTGLNGHLEPVGRVVPVSKPRVAGQVARGATLWVMGGTWKPSLVTLKLQWYAGKKRIAGATRSSLKLTGRTLKAVQGKTISVRVTATAHLQAPATQTATARGRIR